VPVWMLTCTSGRAGAPHVLVIRTPAERLTRLRALGSRRKEDVTGLNEFITGSWSPSSPVLG
jgi:hypothetical protein